MSSKKINSVNNRKEKVYGSAKKIIIKNTVFRIETFEATPTPQDDPLAFEENIVEKENVSSEDSIDLVTNLDTITIDEDVLRADIVGLPLKTEIKNDLFTIRREAPRRSATICFSHDQMYTEPVRNIASEYITCYKRLLKSKEKNKALVKKIRMLEQKNRLLKRK